MLRRNLLVAAVALLLGAGGAGQALAKTDPNGAAQFINALGNEAVRILSSGGGSIEQREANLKRLLAANFDLPLIGKFVLGRAWRGATREQQVEYVNLFSQFVLNTYAQRLGGYQGQSFSVTGAEPIGKQDALVTTLIQRPSGGPLEASWRVRADEGAYKIVDVMVAGVSMAVAQRSEFATVVNSHGLDGLIEALRAKVSRHSVRNS